MHTLLGQNSKRETATRNWYVFTSAVQMGVTITSAGLDVITSRQANIRLQMTPDFIILTTWVVYKGMSILDWSVVVDNLPR